MAFTRKTKHTISVSVFSGLFFLFIFALTNHYPPHKKSESRYRLVIQK